MKSYKEIFSYWMGKVKKVFEDAGMIREQEDEFKEDKPEMDYYENLVTEIENDHKDVIAAYEKKYREKLKEEGKK
jgi:hypothetical protein